MINLATSVFEWFDEVVAAYNLVLLIVVTLIPFTITLVYCFSMRKEKKRRFTLDIKNAGWDIQEQKANEIIIEEKLDQEFKISNYLGSVFLACFFTSIGFSALLFLKPMTAEMHKFNDQLTIQQSTKETGKSELYKGVDFSRGVNILTIGPFQKYTGAPVGSEEYKIFEFRLFMNLAAFQFGFLGAWLYFIMSLVRSYFTCDLRPNTFVNGNIRMIVGSVVALVAAFIIGAPGFMAGESDVNVIYSFVPPVSFIFGFFPGKGLYFIKKVVSKRFALDTKNSNSTSLSVLPGISYMHEIRLEQEGFDNMENLKQANPLDLALRTGFGFTQVSNWIGESWLRHHMGNEDYKIFKAKTGITTRNELKYFVNNQDKVNGMTGRDFLVQAFEDSIQVKIIGIIRIL